MVSLCSNFLFNKLTFFLFLISLGRFNVGALHVLDPLAVERVVVVDSSTLARNAVLEFGQQRGLRIEVASSLDEVQQGTFDLVLLEPFSGGIEPWQG